MGPACGQQEDVVVVMGTFFRAGKDYMVPVGRHILAHISSPSWELWTVGVPQPGCAGMEAGPVGFAWPGLPCRVVLEVDRAQLGSHCWHGSGLATPPQAFLGAIPRGGAAGRPCAGSS